MSKLALSMRLARTMRAKMIPHQAMVEAVGPVLDEYQSEVNKRLDEIERQLRKGGLT